MLGTWWTTWLWGVDVIDVTDVICRNDVLLVIRDGDRVHFRKV